MVWYDFVILAILVYCAWQGASRGLVMQLAWIVALVGCFKFADQLSPTIEPYIGVEQPLRHWISMFVLYLGFSLGAFLVARSLNNALEKAKFKDFDRHLGALFGLLKGGVIAVVVTFFAVTLNESLRETVLKSLSGAGACWILDHLGPLVPEDFPPLLKESYEKYYAKYRDALQPLHEDHGHPSSLEELFLGANGSSEKRASEQGDLRRNSELSHPRDFDESRSGSSGGSDGSYQKMIEALPRRVRDEVGDSLAREWSRATDEAKREMIEQLSRAFPDEVPDIVSGFLSSSGGQGDAERISLLIKQISATYPDTYQTELRIRQYLQEVPRDIQQAVLEDWHADETRSGSDPDPETDRYTRLDDRIMNQLDRAEVPLSRLSSSLRERLERSLR